MNRTKRILAFLAFIMVFAMSHSAFGQNQKTGSGSSGVLIPEDLCIFTTDYLVGGFGGGKWLTVDEVRPMIRGGEKYKRFLGGEPVGEAIGGIPLTEQGPGEWVRVPSQVAGEAGNGSAKMDNLLQNYDELGVSCPWNPQPRKAKAQDLKNPTYLEEIRKILQANKLKAEPKIRELYRFDLEGNGVEEALIIASNADPSVPLFKKNTYALVLFRHVVQGKVETTIMQEEYYREDKGGEANSPTGYSFKGVLDLNGDGVLELILQSRYYEGTGIEVHAIQGNKLKMVLAEGVGA